MMGGRCVFNQDFRNLSTHTATLAQLDRFKNDGRKWSSHSGLLFLDQNVFFCKPRWWPEARVKAFRCPPVSIYSLETWTLCSGWFSCAQFFVRSPSNTEVSVGHWVPSRAVISECIWAHLSSPLRLKRSQHQSSQHNYFAYKHMLTFFVHFLFLCFL